MIYYDSSALIKLLVEEEGTEAVGEHISAALSAGEVLVTSKLTGLELARFAIREGLPLAGVDEVMDRLAEIDISEEVIRSAKAIPHHTKSLDAIHLGSAELLQADSLVTFDVNMLSVAAKMGMVAVSPGAHDDGGSVG